MRLNAMSLIAFPKSKMPVLLLIGRNIESGIERDALDLLFVSLLAIVSALNVPVPS
jgi:hypothetical protein